ncbi:MAG: helix-turn-helix transcriptional regulator [Nocardioidaceae bacterium]|nr:helix-turn-helix transcriptional regulator [Nocardioidaceae bacterium]
MNAGSAEEVPVGLPRTYLRPCLLLLLAEGTSHGYELLDQISALGLDRVDPGGLYRCLRAMDEEGLVRSAWEPSTSGPARRIYELTDEGQEWLHVVAGSLGQVARSLATYRRRYQRIADQQERAR